MQQSHAEGHQRLLEKIEREAGAEFIQAIRDPLVIEVMLNPDGRLWQDKAGEGMSEIGTMPASRAISMLGTCASILGTSITRENPILEGEFPLDGSRLEGLIPPICVAPCFAIRKKATRVFSLEDYVEKGILRRDPPAPSSQAAASDEELHPADMLRRAVRDHENILVVGGTGSGKTTLLNAVIHEISELCPNDRVVTIEDTNELQIRARNAVPLRSTENAPMARLLRATMRLRPDRIIVGEVRGGEAYTLLKSWNSGHPGGLATIHANSAEEGLDKLGQYIFESPDARNFSADMLGRMIASTVHVVVFIEKMPEAPGRIVRQVARVRGFENGRYILES